MILRTVLLQHFRSYTQQKFDFSGTVTVVVGPNTAGKTNLSEAICLLATGKSFRTSTDSQMVEFGQDIGRVVGILEDPDGREKTKVEVVLVSGQGKFGKKFLINDIPRTRATVRTLLPLVVFRPEELEIIIDGPSLRRQFLDEVLEQVDREYARSLLLYQKALRQRNALLDIAREDGYRNEAQFAYWDGLLIENGQVITEKREAFIHFINTSAKEIFDLQVLYDHSKISKERLDQYKDAELGAGNTLVGPHRDDFHVLMDSQNSSTHREEVDVKHFGSRGQQRLVVLQLKLLQIAYIKKTLGVFPLLVLDDIFSELDSGHIALILEKVTGCQIILTTTHREFIPNTKEFAMIELEK